MDNGGTENVSVGLDIGLIATVVRELAGARRNVSSYPKGHPVVVRTCERAAELLARLCADREEITLGVARETLMIGEGSLGTLVPAARNFARTLAHHGIALITFHKGVTAAEIEAFSQILTEKRAKISAEGGIEQIVQGAGIRHLKVCGIQYDAFQVAENAPGGKDDGQRPCCSSLWETFVLSLMQGGDALFRTGSDLKSPVSPEDLAGMVNSQAPNSLPRITEALEKLMRDTGELSQLSSEERSSLAKIGEFTGRLTPELRKLFFDSVLQSCQQQDSSVLKIMPYLSTSAALELFTLSQESEVVLPSHIMSSMEQLAGEFWRESALETQTSQRKPGGLEDRLQIVFREDIIDEFVPADYLETLKTLVASRNIPEPHRDDFQELTSTLADDRIESVVSRIILESLSFASPEQLVALKRNLHELCRYFLEVGDFYSLENIFVQLSGIQFVDEEQNVLKAEILKTFTAPEFVTEVLNGAENWGKDKFEEIGELIQRVGEPFIEPLLDRLGEEDRLTLRRYYLDQLLKMSGRAIEAVCARLGDSRWYFVRNLVLILEHSGDPDVLVHLRKVAGFQHPKVRQRVIEAFLSFGDPEGDRLLLQDLMSRDPEVRQSAIQQAGRSRDPDVVGALMFILEKKGMSPSDVTEKKSAIQALSEIGDSRALPFLDRMLTTRHFLRLSLWKMLKKEILSSLVKYGDPLAMVLVRKVAKSGTRELSRIAANIVDCSGESG
jgi:hypothetical protein